MFKFIAVLLRFLKKYFTILVHYFLTEMCGQNSTVKTMGGGGEHIFHWPFKG